MSTQLHDAAKGTSQDVLSFLRMDNIFGDLIEHKQFVDAYADMIHRLYSEPDISEVMQKL